MADGEATQVTRPAPNAVLAKFRTSCPKCYSTIYRSDPIVRIGRQWFCQCCGE